MQTVYQPSADQKQQKVPALTPQSQDYPQTTEIKSPIALKIIAVPLGWLENAKFLSEPNLSNQRELQNACNSEPL